jgi:PAS domain S-box-containing protein
MQGEPQDPKADFGEPAASEDNRGDQPVSRPADIRSQSETTRPESRIQELVASFDERAEDLHRHISDLETRLSELSASRDRLQHTLDSFLNLENLTDILRSTQDPLKVVVALQRVLSKLEIYDDMGIFLRDEVGKGFQPLGPMPAELVQAAQGQYDEGIYDWVISERRPVVVPWLESGKPLSPAKNLVIAPLLAGPRPLGMVLLTTPCRSDEFSAQDFEILTFIVSHAALGLVNSMRLRELAEARDFLLSLLGNAGDLIFSLDQQGRFTYVNPVIEELGYRSDELMGQSFQILFRQANVGERIQEVLTRGGKIALELEVGSRLARHQHYILSLAPLKNERNEKVGALGVLRNITESNRRQRKQLESERLAAYTQTVITLNHEINNPLTAVLGNLYLLEKETRRTGDEKALERLKIIQENCLRIQKVIKKLERIEELKTVSYLGETKMVDIGNVQDDSKKK